MNTECGFLYDKACCVERRTLYWMAVLRHKRTVERHQGGRMEAWWTRLWFWWSLRQEELYFETIDVVR